MIKHGYASITESGCPIKECLNGVTDPILAWRTPYSETWFLDKVIWTLSFDLIRKYPWQIADTAHFASDAPSFNSPKYNQRPAL